MNQGQQNICHFIGFGFRHDEGWDQANDAVSCHADQKACIGSTLR
jgi:hypothetical protein